MKSLWISLAALVTATPACGGSNARDLFDEEDTGASIDATADSSTVTDDAATDASGIDSTTPPADTAPADTPPPVTLDTVCSRLADGVCGAPANTCCVKSGIGFDATGCRTNILASCGASVAAVKAGTKKFQPAAFGACVDAWNKLETACIVNVIEFGRTYPPCQQLFNGTLALGAACKQDSDCAAAPGAFADCTDPTFPFGGSTCSQFTVVGKDAPCNVGGDTQAICDLGLYCAITSSGATKGTCKTAKKLGESCNPSVWWECGFGFVCRDPSPFGTATCVEGQPAGASCSREADCASWNCTANKCGPTSFPIASRELCGR